MFIERCMKNIKKDYIVASHLSTQLELGRIVRI
jgi:hypothetical protein